MRRAGLVNQRRGRTFLEKGTEYTTKEIISDCSLWVPVWLEQRVNKQQERILKKHQEQMGSVLKTKKIAGLLPKSKGNRRTVEWRILQSSVTGALICKLSEKASGGKGEGQEAGRLILIMIQVYSDKSLVPASKKWDRHGGQREHSQLVLWHKHLQNGFVCLKGWFVWLGSTSSQI